MEFLNNSQNNNLLSCVHDSSINCSIYAKCCNKYYGCFKCHDEENIDHKIFRCNINKLKCNKCNSENEIGNECSNCNISFATYSCIICKIWTNSQKIYHCNDCNSCLVGKKENNFHCNNCKVCISINLKDNHKCNPDAINSFCQICSNKVFDKKNDIKILACGHFIHKECNENAINNSSTKKHECIDCSYEKVKEEEANKKKVAKVIKENNNELQLKKEIIKPEIVISNCSHNNNDCLIYAKCCNKYYECFLCHDENNSHTVSRSMISNLLCKKCNTKNEIGNECSNCKIKFAEKYCLICKIWSNEIKDLYHCHDCDSCCIGKKENFFHCHTCKICLSNSCKESHKCNIISKTADCSICLDKIFDKKSDIKILNCSHMLHQKCYESLVSSSLSHKSICKCTICKKSIFLPKDQESKYDNYVKDHIMPDYYKDWKAEILCNDCCCKNTVKYHSDYMKCGNTDCRSYNVTKLNIIKT